MEPLQLLRIDKVLERTGLKRSSLYRKIRAGEFPPPVKLGERASGWPSSEIDKWIEKTIRVSRSSR